MFGCGFVGPNAVALALQRYPEAAGAASAVLGSFQFVLAAAVAPLAGVSGTAEAGDALVAKSQQVLGRLVAALLVVHQDSVYPVVAEIAIHDDHRDMLCDQPFRERAR